MTLSKINSNLTVRCTLKYIGKFTNVSVMIVLNKEIKALKKVLTAYAVEIQILESLILAQDERWRRA